MPAGPCVRAREPAAAAATTDAVEPRTTSTTGSSAEVISTTPAARASGDRDDGGGSDTSRSGARHANPTKPARTTHKASTCGECTGTALTRPGGGHAVRRSADLDQSAVTSSKTAERVDHSTENGTHGRGKLLQQSGKRTGNRPGPSVDGPPHQDTIGSTRNDTIQRALDVATATATARAPNLHRDAGDLVGHRERRHPRSNELLVSLGRRDRNTGHTAGQQPLPPHAQAAASTTPPGRIPPREETRTLITTTPSPDQHHEPSPVWTTTSPHRGSERERHPLDFLIWCRVHDSEGSWDGQAKPAPPGR